MKSSGELMTAMNNVIKTSVVAKTMMELSKEMFKVRRRHVLCGHGPGSVIRASPLAGGRHRRNGG
jgi:hypothetical protein